MPVLWNSITARPVHWEVMPRWSVFALGLGIGALAASLVFVGVSGRLSRSLRRLRDAHQDAAGRADAAEADRSAREAILSSLEDAIVLFSPQGRVVYRNAVSSELLGGGLDGLAGLASTALRRLVASASDGGPVPLLEVLLGPTGRIVQASASRIPDGHVLLVLRDVTGARVGEAVRRDFVANASHELKTPVASIQALAETLLSAASADPAAVPRFAEQLERESVRLSRVVGDLLDLSRLESGAGERERIRLDRLVEEEAERLHPRSEEAGLTVVLQTKDPVPIHGSARDVRLLIRNLMENAIQYSRPGGTIEVAVRADGGEAVVTVADTGVGIPTRDRDRIFERFYRVDRARSRETGGTGLGLSIVKHVVENHGGNVTVESELGRGSTFTVRFPPRDAPSRPMEEKDIGILPR